MNVAEALEKIADYTDIVGHHCGPAEMEGIGKDGSLCIVRAAGRCGIWINDDVSIAIHSVLIGTIGTRYNNLVDWSDATDHKTFTATLRTCAAIERAKAAQVTDQRPVEVCA